MSEEKKDMPEQEDTSRKIVDFVKANAKDYPHDDKHFLFFINADRDRKQVENTVKGELNAGADALASVLIKDPTLKVLFEMALKIADLYSNKRKGCNNDLNALLNKFNIN